VEITFAVRDDGQVDVRLPDAWPILNEALNDSISSLPPRGARGNGPSTYWIDRAEQGARLSVKSRPFVTGNATTLRVMDQTVLANYDYAEDDEPGESMPLSDFLELLREWRVRVLKSASTATRPLPETYRRNAAAE
jgi:hypothetical protein